MSTDQIRVTDPAAITDAASTVLSLNVFQRLMTADPGGSVLKPDAARDCLFTSATTYTCTLNDELAFHNGHPLTSSDEVQHRAGSTAQRSRLFGSLAVFLPQDPDTGPEDGAVHAEQSRHPVRLGASPAASIVDEETYDADRVQRPG